MLSNFEKFYDATTKVNLLYLAVGMRQYTVMLVLVTVQIMSLLQFEVFMQIGFRYMSFDRNGTS